MLAGRSLRYVLCINFRAEQSFTLFKIFHFIEIFFTALDSSYNKTDVFFKSVDIDLYSLVERDLVRLIL